MLTLLGDDDPEIVRTIQDQFLSVGDRAYELLEENRLHPEPSVRRRIRSLLNERAASRYDSEFLAFVLSQGEHFDLEQGVWKFTLTTHPDINVAAFQAQLDAWADQVREQLGPTRGPGVILDTLNDLLFQQLGFRGNSENYFDPANSYLNRVMDRRLGIPISLCAIYLFLGRRLGLPLVGIGMPGHFLCRFQSTTEEIFVDPFHGGKLLSRLDCRKRLAELAIEYDERHLAPVSNRRTLQRMIANLHLIHKERRHREEVERLQRYLVALSR
jgi:regulator of sirC expression with transglutaminase-like and TPR domain